MAFSETVKQSVRRKSHLSCCLCKKIGIEIHHIIPQEENGPDTEDNAAPLCPSCHETYGANKTKRKFIKEARDLWYEICERRYSSDSDKLDEIREIIKNSPSREDIHSFRDYILSNIVKEITQSTLFTVGKPKTETPTKPVFWSIDEIIGYLYSLSGDNYGVSKKNWEFLHRLLFEQDMREKEFELTADEEEFEMTKEEFLFHFGHQAAKKLCLYQLIHNNIDFYSGFTTEEFASLWKSCFIDMILLLSHEDINKTPRSIKLSLTNDNQFIAWPSKMRTRKKKKSKP